MSGTLVYECFSGISGDMHIGAMIDVGVPVDHFRTELARLSLGNEFDLVVEPGAKMGITGTKATVAIDTATEPGHRHLPRIHRLIEEAGLNTNVTTIAKDIFQVLAEAEAKIHGIEVDKVHFHEVGATDSIVDIVAAAIGIDYLAPRPDPVRTGRARQRHGQVCARHHARAGASHRGDPQRCTHDPRPGLVGGHDTDRGCDIEDRGRPVRTPSRVHRSQNRLRHRTEGFRGP